MTFLNPHIFLIFFLISFALILILSVIIIILFSCIILLCRSIKKNIHKEIKYNAKYKPSFYEEKAFEINEFNDKEFEINDISNFNIKLHKMEFNQLLKIGISDLDDYSISDDVTEIILFNQKNFRWGRKVRI